LPPPGRVEFNVGSPKQLGEVLFDKMNLPGGKRMKTGAWGTDSSVLQALADQGHELPSRILEWRQLQKLKSTYADALVEQINPDTGRVHTSFAMAIAQTGRLSSTDPNLQNIPIRTEEGSRIRHAFIAEPGNVLVSADYSQIELRLLAHVADIPALKESFARGEDIHARTASEVFGMPMEGMDAMTRRRAKAINFGIIYGISGFGLARQLGIGQGEARGYIDAYFERYPGIRDYMEQAKGKPGSTATSRRRSAAAAGSPASPTRTAGAPRLCRAAGDQRAVAGRRRRHHQARDGASARRAARGGLTARMLLQVHDELLFEAPEAEAAELAGVAARDGDPPPPCPCPGRRNRHRPHLGRGALRLSHPDDGSGHPPGGSVRLCRKRYRQPPEQYVQPPSCARFKPQTPDGMTVIPGTTFAAHSFAASSALTPALPASALLIPCKATSHAPTTVPLASSRSIAAASTCIIPGLGCRNGFFTAGALVSGSVILSASPILYLPHIALPRAIGSAPARNTTTETAEPPVATNVYANSSACPPLTL
jgi:hypothetical protein